MSTEPQGQNIEDCKICHGVLSVEIKVPGGYRIDPCRCALAEQTRKNVELALIPRKFQEWDLRNLQKNFKLKNKGAIQTIKSYADNISERIKNGKGLWISSPAGLNKNAFMCYVLRSALDNGHRACYCKAATLLNKKLEYRDSDSRYFVHKFTHYMNIVAIADIEKADTAGGDFRALHFYEMLSDLDENRLAILISSNVPKDAVLKKMPVFMRQRLRPLQDIVLRHTLHEQHDEEDY